MSKLQGPFEVSTYNHEVVDASGNVVADCNHYSVKDQTQAAANAQMVAAALNAVYYMHLATGETT